MSDEIDKYISQFPKKIQQVLQQVRKAIQQAAPEAEESISYGMPGYKLNGNPLVYFAGYKNHIGFYATPSGHKEFAAALSKYKQGKGSVQFPLEQPMPLALITKIVKFRVKEKQEKMVKKKAISKNHITYHKDGSIWAKGKMKGDQMEGYWEWFRKDGTIMRSGHFKDGKQVGEWITYDKEGKVYKITKKTV